MPADPRYMATFTVLDPFNREQTLSIGAENGRIIMIVSGPSPSWKSDGTDLQELAIHAALYGACELARKQRGESWGES